MGSKIRDLTKEKFGKLQPVKMTEESDRGSKVWFCLCDCGGQIERSSRLLTSKHSWHCGCVKSGTHNMTGTPTYRSWSKMLSRVNSDSEEYIKWYKDVSVCVRWDKSQGGSFENFLEDMGERPEGMTLNRIHGAKVYSKETCEWANLSVQSYDQKMKSTNKSGKTGVKWREDRDVWESRISVNRGIKIVYYGKSYADALLARCNAELKYFGFIKP